MRVSLEVIHKICEYKKGMKLGHKLYVEFEIDNKYLGWVQNVKKLSIWFMDDPIYYVSQENGGWGYNFSR